MQVPFFLERERGPESQIEIFIYQIHHLEAREQQHFRFPSKSVPPRNTKTVKSDDEPLLELLCSRKTCLTPTRRKPVRKKMKSKEKMYFLLIHSDLYPEKEVIFLKAPGRKEVENRKRKEDIARTGYPKVFAPTTAVLVDSVLV
ncbi:hypothetical protein RUM44_010395 [Polyplax serrata]|uniref:Uncharacterized protein n=1 Tax=Polyplax serrata TaxID=468196 RepID=A0ABR1AVE8_POLSC